MIAYAKMMLFGFSKALSAILVVFFISGCSGNVEPIKVNQKVVDADSAKKPGLDASLTSKPVGLLPGDGSSGVNRTYHLGNNVMLEMVLIPAGKFVMGGKLSEGGFQVEISKPFYLGKYEVNQDQWQQVMGKNPSSTKETLSPNAFVNGDWVLNGLLPVDHISWDDAQEFCVKLKNITKSPFTIPTEAQWEYACRAGTTTDFHFGDELNGTQANSRGDVPHPYGIKKGPYLGKICQAGKYPPNKWGLYDMHGNVREWCSNWHTNDINKNDTKDPKGPESGEQRVMRGGAFNGPSDFCTSSYSQHMPQFVGLEGNGVRILLPLDF
jgi:formylglycine-generating enzyme required for sulfatase activity